MIHVNSSPGPLQGIPPNLHQYWRKKEKRLRVLGHGSDGTGPDSHPGPSEKGCMKEAPLGTPDGPHNDHEGQVHGGQSNILQCAIIQVEAHLHGIFFL